MSEQPNEAIDLPEDDGVLEPSDSLETDDLSMDPLDTGVLPPDRWSPAERYGVTLSESRAGETLDQKLAEEEPDVDPDGSEDPGDVWPRDGSLPPDPRAGRLVADDEGIRSITESEFFAHDVGIDGGAAGAEEAAIHVVDDDTGDAEDWADWDAETT
jgi:Family of unknown function (DUF5709)